MLKCTCFHLGPILVFDSGVQVHNFGKQVKDAAETKVTPNYPRIMRRGGESQRTFEGYSSGSIHKD